MKAFLECVPCVLNQIIKILRKNVKRRKKREEVLRAVMKRLSNLYPSLITPPELTHEAYEVMREMLGDQDFYIEEKKLSNKEAFLLLPRLRKTMKKSKTPLETGILLSIAGNIIDYGPEHPFDVKQTLKRVLGHKLSHKHLAVFKRCLKKSQRILYVCDNAGEIVFDRVLIEYLSSQFNLEVTVAVKSGPTLNDALICDAREAGLNKIAKLIESGSVNPGTSVSSGAPQFKKAYADADMIIAKGQGNFETLPHNSKTFFLLMIKCRHLALATGLNYGDIVLWSKR